MKFEQRGSLAGSGNGPGIARGAQWIHRAGGRVFCWDGAEEVWDYQLEAAAVVQPRQLLQSPVGIGILHRRSGRLPAQAHCLRPFDGSPIWKVELPGRVLDRRPGAACVGGDFLVYVSRGNEGELCLIRSESGRIEDRASLAHVMEVCMGAELAWVGSIRGLWACDERMELHRINADRGPQYLHAARGHLAYAVRARGGVEVVVVREEGQGEVSRLFLRGVRPALYPLLMSDGRVAVRPDRGVQIWDYGTGTQAWEALGGHATAAALAIPAGLVVLGQAEGDDRGHETPIWLLEENSGRVLDAIRLHGIYSTAHVWGDDVVLAGLSGLKRLSVGQ